MKAWTAATLAASLIAATLPGLALAQASPPAGPGMHGGHGGSGAGAIPSASDTAATGAYKAAHVKMMRDMAIAYSNDADVDFVRGMIPHHQAAIDAAKVVLQYGKDPETRKLAQAIIGAQEQEIASMKAWLAARGK